MTAALWFFVFAFPAALFWTASRAASERATAIGKQLCEKAGVQWLDQSVHQIKLSLARDSNGRLHWKRAYRYEYSHGGEDRYSGTITLLGLKALSWIEPIRIQPTI